ncbi:MurR/RpiR family transcriptional regulator [Telmatospirillum sp. J64-1]|uniref:MurR/RpiR family transcriptional regulator n=1 Tax=Telmatospirillum sp. J64-1 TaxID=2502183 RepID=UPI00115E4B50|nr:MurR/RpiR family transcriptional regulator [Telmatospirillum sp. J64-1]
MAPAERSFLSRVRNALPDLHPAERRLGEFLCDFPGELASYSAQELAKLANVSKATVSRFVRRLGYESYEEARRHARAEGQTGSRLFLALPSGDGAEASLAANIEQGKANLDRTFATISQVEIDAVARAMLAARKVWVLGFRASHPFATYLQWQLTQVIENIVAIPSGGETLGEHLVSIRPEDCVIVFGLRRRVARMEPILKVIGRSGAKFLYVTDEGLDPYREADWHFRCQTLAPGPLFNHVAVMAVCHLLATRAIEIAGAEGRGRLRGIEMLNDMLDEL